MRLLIALALTASVGTAAAQTTSTSAANTSTTSTSFSFSSLASKFGASYFTFVEGISLRDGGNANNEIGKPVNTQAFNFVSLYYKLNDRINFDVQSRIAYVHSLNRDQGNSEWQFQGMRAGISGKLASGKNWSLKGAANTDIPGLNGRDAIYRTLIFNPGLFAGLSYQISDRWSFYSVLTPRIYFYRDDNAVEPEWLASGRDPGQKRRLELRGSPTINYAVNDKFGLRTGVDLNFQNFVGNDANYIRRWATPWTIGPTYKFHQSFNVYTFVQTFPFDGQGITTNTASIGMWLNGTLF